MMLFEVRREIFTADFTLGSLWLNGGRLGYTCEDEDRHLETGGNKIYGKTAIPRGTYKLELSYSPHFNRVLPELIGVPGYTYSRIHGGNTAADTLGCILAGSVRTGNGCAVCAATIEQVVQKLELAKQQGEEAWLKVS